MVKYPEVEVNYGNQIYVLDSLVKPTVTWNDTDDDAEPDSLYTLMFVNLDLGKPYFIHWLVTNIHHGNVEKAAHTLSYKFPDPPFNGNVPYRMVFLVYRQPGLEPYHVDVQLGHPPNRAVFSILDFAEQLNLTEFPVAGNFFLQETRLSDWLPLDPPAWMRPFIPYINNHHHDHGVWEMNPQ
ncbi:phosphatidylethanolamine-binding protein domain-containing protein [Phthorimaea operculella]|nr:phosphatidylethanolamine-binding protein domain-containing protein [Phthorimaea operculella]